MRAGKPERKAPAQKKPKLQKSAPPRARPHVVQADAATREKERLRLRRRRETLATRRHERLATPGRTLVAVKHGPVTWSFPLQPWTGSYGGQGFAKPSCFLDLKADTFSASFLQLWEEHLPGFTGHAFAKARRKDGQRQMLWKQLLTTQQEEKQQAQSQPQPAPKAAPRQGDAAQRTRKAAVTGRPAGKQQLPRPR
jgi:hypothetical protein